MVAEKRRRGDSIGANAGRYGGDRNAEHGFFNLPRARVTSSASLQHPYSTGPQRLPSVSTFLRPPPIDTTVASSYIRPPLDLSIQIPQAQWALEKDAPAQSASTFFQIDNQAPSPTIMRTRRRFSPRSRLRASKRLGGHPAPSWSRPVGISIPPSRSLLLREGGISELQRHRQELQRPAWQESPAPIDAVQDHSEKRSRYLHETDRRHILARSEHGEKQSALAKEFRDTRAAICSLSKHHSMIGSSPCANPMGNHQKPTPRSSSAASDDDDDCKSVNSWRSDVSNSARGVHLAQSSRLPEPESVQVYHVTTRPVQMLLALMQDGSDSDAALEHHSVRVMTCMIEEAVAWVYSSHVLPGSSSDLGDARPSTRGFSLDKYFTRLPPCGVAVDEIGRLFLDRFHAMEPRWGTGIIELADSPSSDRGSDALAVVHIDLPAALPACTVFLLLAFVRGAASRKLQQSVRILLEHGVLEELLCLVSLGISQRAIRHLLAEFPRLRVATAAIDASETEPSGDGSSCSGSEYDSRQPGVVAAVTTPQRIAPSSAQRMPTERLARLKVSGATASRGKSRPDWKQLERP